MIKTIIVDDEIWVIKLIRNIVKWEELGYCIIGEADNCEDAMRLIEKEAPQLLITDIRIPGKDGIELMRKAREIAPDISIVVISGYSEFEYAKKAMSYGAYAYLLKPLDRTELTEVLMGLHERIDTDEKAKKEQREKLEQNRESRRQQLLLDIMQGRLLKGDDIHDVNTSYYTSFCENKYIALRAMLLYRGSGAEVPEIRAELEKKLYDTIDARLAAICADVVKTMDDSGVLMLLNFGKKQRDISDKINEAYRMFSREYLSGGEYRLIMGKSAERKKLYELKEAFDEASAAVKHRIYSENAGVIVYSAGYKKRPIQEIMNVADEKRLRRSVEICDEEETKQIINELFMQKEKLDPEDVFSLARLVTDIFFQTWRSQSELMDEEGITTELILKRIENALTLTEITDIFTDTVSQVRKLILDMQCTQPERIATKVKIYIHRHYKEKLTLKMICGSMYLSPPYVCSVFKQQEGMTILEYLTSYRISIAKELLLSNRYQINDVMVMVGYNDAKYFVKVFKKQTGMTPSDYKKLFM